MWVLEQVTIICLAQFIMIPSTYSKPHTNLNNNQAKGNNQHSEKKYFTVQETRDSKNYDTNSDSILKAFNFQDIEYPVAATPRPQPFYFQDFNNQSPQRNFISDASNIRINSDLKSVRNATFNNGQKFGKLINKNNANKPMNLALPKEFNSGSDFRNVGNFPEVEYPLSAKETWKPNYWSIPSGSKDVNALLTEDSNLKQNLANIYPTKNSGITNKLGKCRSFTIKSYSDIIKNKERLKQVLENKTNNNTNDKQNISICRNDFTTNREENFGANNIISIPGENTEQELYTTAVPYYFTPILPECEEFNIDVSNIFSVFNKSSYQQHHQLAAAIPLQNALIPKIIKTNNSFIDNNVLNFEEESRKSLNLNNNDRKDIISNNIQEMNYDLYDIISIRKPETGSDLCGLDEDYTTDIYSEDNNIEWFSHPITTPPPFSTTTLDLTWKNCKIFAPCEYNVDELEDYYISV